jgi:crotonobetaine/carnitine-CoA ligase
MTLIRSNQTVLSLLQERAHSAGETLFAAFQGQNLTIAELYQRVGHTVAELSRAGIIRGDRVAVMLDNNLDYVVLYFALMQVGAIHIPVNTRLRHDSLDYLMAHCDPALIIAEEAYLEFLQAGQLDGGANTLVTRTAQSGIQWKVKPSGIGSGRDVQYDDDLPATDQVILIMYTSGTTGPPKGVMVTDRMLRASSVASAITCAARSGDIFPVWEPLYHIGAAQLLPLALTIGVELHFIGSFSASQFWGQAREIGATHIHFLGGILQMLLCQKPDVLDKQHHCRIAWGGGAPVGVAERFESRFGVEVRENYGMTEASSLTSINEDGHKGSVGKPAPYFEVRIVDSQHCEAPIGTQGEIVVRSREYGLITPGYFRNAQATRETIRNSWLHTGDLGCLDAAGYLYYAGRLKESIRRRGENISAWEIERVVERLAWVEQAAVIGVPDDLGDEDIKLFIKLADEAQPVEVCAEIFNWCRRRLPAYQMPTYLSVVRQFPLTGTKRIRKEMLSRSVDGCMVEQ